jgi:N-acetylneuraminate synthase
MNKPLFIFEMANNHMGDVAHGVALIRAMREACAGFPFSFAFKLQYRNLETFIHPAFKGREDVKYVRRFEETRLEQEELAALLEAMREHGFRTICTPFDEASVDLIESQGIEIIKIASCSLTDWPLLERIALAEKPVIASTAGAAPEEVDQVVSFFTHRGKALSLMHCVAEYPTPPDHLHLCRIDALRARYPGIRIGFSTHEDPRETEPVMAAIAKGARVFEKHVGLPSERYALNAYSANPDEIRVWLDAARRAFLLCGDDAWPRLTPEESASLASLRRGVFLRRDVALDATLSNADVCFAFPSIPGQITANQWSKYLSCTATRNLAAGEPLLLEAVRMKNTRNDIMAAVLAVRQLLEEGNIVVPGKSELEISHHYGMERFPEFGLTIVMVVNREYCKKLLVMLPGQTHPEQYHRRKEETFVILHGELILWLDGAKRLARRGDVITVHRNVRHKFHSPGGVVFEEISSTHYLDDSFYADPAIAANAHRKTLLTYWLQTDPGQKSENVP